MVRQLRAEQDKRCTAGVEQCLDGAPLVVATRDCAEHQVVAMPLGSFVDVLYQLCLVRVADIDHDAHQPAASAGQHTRRPIRSIPQPDGGGGDSLLGRSAWTGNAAEYK